MKKALIIGAAMLDIVMQLDELPKRGGDVYAKSDSITVGGCAYNVADIVKHMGVPYTLFAPVGKGNYASMVRSMLKIAGHESPISSEKQDNGYCLCLVEKDGERTFITLPGIECTFEKEWFDLIDVDEYDSVYVSGYEIEGEGGDCIIDFLENNPQLTVYYAPGPRITCIPEEKHERIFRTCPVVHLNEEEALAYTGMSGAEAAAEAISRRCGNNVIVTLGGEGVLLYIEDEKDVMRIPSEKVKVVDTIGAGDSHIGGIMAMRAKGYGFPDALRAANRVSAAVVTVEGPSLSEEEFEKIDLSF